jgi:3-dehydroquinate synthase
MSMGAPERRVVRVSPGGQAYDVVVGDGLLDELGPRVKSLSASGALGGIGPLLVVTNPLVRGLYGDRAASSLEKAELSPSFVEIPDGEQFKSMKTLESILDAALRRGGDRSSVLVALGGGVVGDLTGFAAATLYRGVRLVMVPTTLLAQVDSSVGGKTGINRPEGKNLVGAFHQPSLVLADTGTLATLSPREYRAGLAEVVKYGVILDETLFELLEREAPRIVARDAELLRTIVERSVAIKARVVEQDEKEQGMRRLLNFGHTAGHAIEKVSGYSRFLHGEAVGIGMAIAARLSRSLGVCGDTVPERLERLLEALELESALPGDLDRDAIVAAVAFDKKSRGERVVFVLAEAIGRCVQRELEPAALRAVL